MRINELALKSDRKQNFFISTFVAGLEDALRKQDIVDFEVVQHGHSIFLAYDKPKELEVILRSLPGLELFAITTRVEFDSFDSLLESAIVLTKDLLVGKSFRVTARRFGKHDFSSVDLAMKLGEALLPFADRVDLHSPEVTVFAEVRNSKCFVHTAWQRGIGGMPVGSSGKALVLFSGGIDCPVAMYHTLRKGCFVDSLFVNMVGESARGEVFNVYNYVIDRFAYAYKPKMFEVDARSLPQYLAKHVPNTLRQQALKIVFYQLAKGLLAKSGAWAVVTGESLSQKSTQTIQSLDMIQHHASPLLVLRPLITYDKQEIVAVAREIGTFAASEQVKEHCNISAGKVTAVPHPKDFDRVPDLTPIVEELLKKITVHEGLIDTLLDDTGSLSEIPDTAVVVDVRTFSMIKKKPIPSDVISPYPAVLDKLSDFTDKSKQYVFVCQFGVLGKEAAYLLKKRNMKAVGMSYNEFMKL